MKILLLSAAMAAQTAATAAESSFQLEEMLVVGERDLRSIELVETLDLAPDTAVLLKRTAGANVTSNGPLSGMAHYRGMSRMRVSTQINGVMISPGGPNWMDPPLSYAPAAMVETLEVHRGVAPVSAGQETIGGVVNANNWRGHFSDGGWETQTRVRAGAQSVNESTLLSGAVALASEQHKLFAAGFVEEANDADFADGQVLPTEYERDRFDVGYGFRQGAHELEVTFGRNNTGDAGTPALPMDIAWIDSDLYSASHRFGGERVQVETRVYYNDIDHGMTNYHLRQPPAGGGGFRRNMTDAENLGGALSVTMGAWRFGVDAHETTHNSDIDNPNNPMFFVRNFNEAERNLYGVFAERQLRLGERVLLDLGVRYNRVEMDADDVDATPAVMGMPPAVALRDAFNDADRSIDDNNVDWVSRLSWRPTANTAYHLAVARKTRAPSYQERFLWLPLQATAGLADGRTYTGNLDLDSEVAHEIELGADWQRGALSLSPRLFYRDVDDYIQGTPSENAAAVMFVRMMSNVNGTNAPDPLEFNNVDAEFYGFDVDWRLSLSERWSLGGVVNYVRGKRDDVNDDLYRVPPLNAFVALSYERPRWGATLESFVSDEQQNVSETNGEPETDSYAVFNLRGYYRLTDALRLAAGIDNLADENYEDHLGGINRARGNPDIAVGERLPGYGRNAFLRLDWAL